MTFTKKIKIQWLLTKQREIFFQLGDAFIVGALAGLAGGGFRLFVSHIEEWRKQLFFWFDGVSSWSWLVAIVLSAFTIFISIWMVRRYAPETSGSGVQEIEGALEGVRPVRWRRVLPVKFISSLLSLGSGMVLGREGPTIQMGASIGKMIGDKFHRTREEIHMLLAAGAGAGLAAAFNAPFAGTIFVIEEMRTQYKYNFLSFQLIMVAAATSDIVVRGLTKQGPIIDMTIFPAPPLSSLWLFLIFGAIFGVLGFFFNRLIVSSLNSFSGLHGWKYKFSGIFVGAVIGLIGWKYPDAIGGGYDVIAKSLSHSYTVQALIILFGVRYLLTLFNYGSGASGGIFAPMIALGTLLGLWFGYVTHGLFPGLVGYSGFFAVAGMAAMFAATVKAPLTGIALAVEMTSNFNQILPLILTCAGATIVSYKLGSKPIYSILLKRTLDMERDKEIDTSKSDKKPDD